MIKKYLASVAMLSLVAACSSTPEVQTGDGAEVIGDNLHRVDNSKADVAYIDPDADFSKYTKVMIRPLGVNKIEVIQPSKTGTSMSRRDWELTDADKQMLQDTFHSAMLKNLQDKGDFPLVDEPGDDVLEIGAMITAIAPSAAKDDGRSRAMGRSYVITDGSGAIAVAVAFGDSETGEVLALIKDSRSSSSHWGLNNSVTNKADVQRMFNSWAMQINSSLVEVSGKQ
ncbi:MAG: DUF3313 family protein [Halioglobus sp.]|jgi:hypothetical protein|nr:DUF3313 family protein [Halioglobus sp.]MDG2328154.1 DUF3313 family protein [Halioglobus sp.]